MDIICLLAVDKRVWDVGLLLVYYGPPSDWKSFEQISCKKVSESWQPVVVVYNGGFQGFMRAIHMSIKYINCTQRERGDHETLCISHRDAADVIELKKQCPIASTYRPSLPYIPQLNTIFINLHDLWPRYAYTWRRLYTFRNQNHSKVIITQQYVTGSTESGERQPECACQFQKV